MNDRELLELAAKALQANNPAWNEGEYVDAFRKGFMDNWNPLSDSGDALRLASGLLFLVSMDSGFTRVTDQDGNNTYVCEHGIEGTRRAIVRAAAEIGRTMP